MKRAAIILAIAFFGSAALAGFKVKNVKPKKPEQFQSQVTIAGVTYAADLLLDGKDQKVYFYKELTPSNFVAVRLAIFNNGKDEVILPLDGLELLTPDKGSIHLISPDLVAKAILDQYAAAAASKSKMQPVQVGAGGATDPRRDPANPQYDPRLDPNSPRYDPNDPRNRGQYPPGTYPTGTIPGTYPPGTTPGTYPPGSYPTGSTVGRPGVVLNPGGGGGGGEDLSQFERQLAEKDYCDKAHTVDPVLSSTSRDRFLYFPTPISPAETKGYALRLPVSKGIPEEVLLKF